MALETVLHSQDPFGNYGFKDFYSLLGATNWNYDMLLQQQQQELNREDKISLGSIFNNTAMDDQFHSNWDYSTPSPPNSSQYILGHISHDSNSPPSAPNVFSSDPSFTPAAEDLPDTGRRKRRRTRNSKNKEELETQRMTHIAVERNRRKQMNEYLAILRSLMPPSYVQRGDQASIVAGAINFVKELEQSVLLMEGNSKRKTKDESDETSRLAEFFSFPQYTNSKAMAADIEVNMVDRHANVKIMAKKRPRLLVKVVEGLQRLGLAILHLNVTTVHQMVLYSVSVKVEEGSPLNSVDEIAASVNQMMGRIQEETVFT